MTTVARGTVLSFNTADWTALILLEGSDNESQIPVGQWIPSAMMTVAATVAVLLFDETNTDDAVVLGPYGAVNSWNFPAIGAAANGQLLIGNGSGMVLATLTGTANRVTVTNGAGTITLSGPQDLDSAAAVTHGSLNIGTATGAGAGTIITQGNVAVGLTTDTSAASLSNNYRDTATNTQPNNFTLSRLSSATPAAGFGQTSRWLADTSNHTLAHQFDLITQWVVATDASQTARVTLNVYDTALREAVRMQASGTAPMLGFLGAAAVARPAAYTQTYATAARTLTQGAMTDPAAYAAGTNGYSTAAMASAIHAEVIALKANMVVTQNVLNSVIDDLQAYGLLA